MLAFVKHRDDAGEVAEEVHVVLDDHDRAVLRDLLEQLAGSAALALAHAGDRLVEQQQLVILHQQHADLEPLPLTVRQHRGGPFGQIGQPGGLERRGDAIVDVAPPAKQRSSRGR